VSEFFKQKLILIPADDDLAASVFFTVTHSLLRSDSDDMVYIHTIQAVGIWTGKDDIDHAYLIGCYLHFANNNGGFENITARDLSTRKGRDKRIFGDPLYVVTAQKSF
jgi:hypothetical protein